MRGFAVSGQLSIAVVDLDELEKSAEGASGASAPASSVPPAASPDMPEVARTPPEAPAEAAAASAVTWLDSVAAAELWALPVRLLVPLPLPTTALCRAEGVPAPVVLTSSKAAYTAARARRWPIFVGSELSAMALAAENDRLVPADVVGWCARKAEDGGWKVSVAGAHGLGEVMGKGLEARGWTFGQLLRAAGLGLLEVVAGDDEGAELVERAAGEGAA